MLEKWLVARLRNNLLKTGQRSFAFKGGTCWNKLPKDVKEVADCLIFKKTPINIFLKWRSSFSYLKLVDSFSNFLLYLVSCSI